jgi:hypothetical protein
MQAGRDRERLPIGTRVQMQAPHPWAGEQGEVIAYEVLGLFPEEGPRPRVRMDNGRECFATEAGHMKRL